MRFAKFLTAFVVTSLSTTAIAQTPLRPDQTAFRALYKELVETNTTPSVGSCTQAAAQIATLMKAAGYSDKELTLFSVPEHPKDGGLVAVLQGTSKKAKPILLLAHIDVVEANRADWTRDPFTLIEENGYFYARGVSDDKAQAAIWADSLIRYKAEGFKPKRTIKMALTCGEETSGAFNGAQWLTENRKDLIAAEYALNEGGGGRVDKDGKPQILAMQVGEKAYQDFTLEATNPGGHSSMPRPDNAIYSLTAAVSKVAAYRFPVQFNDTTRSFFTKTASALGGEAGVAITALLADPSNEAADAAVSRDPVLHSTLRTTCVATLLSAGHATNALPQRATANINCRMFPGTATEDVQAALAKAINDPLVTISPVGPPRPRAVPPPLSPKIMGPAEELGKKMFPGVPMLPIMSTGATDAVFFGTIPMPVYGIAGIFYDADGGGIHGLNERIRTKSVYDGRDYLHQLVKLYSQQD